jgi:dsRNA-specific ribonuclease
MSREETIDYLMQHPEFLFGTRNGITPKLEPVKNYTAETIKYMTPYARANEVTQGIVDRMPVRPFTVVECCAGIGGNTLSFLENPNIDKVISYEILPDRRLMLKNNIAAYHLGDKSEVEKTGFNGLRPEEAGAVLYLDPPWLPPDRPGHKAGKEEYILEGIRIGALTIEEWMEQSRHAAMVVMRVPPGYQLKPVQGFQYESQPIKKSLVIYATSEEGMRLAQEKQAATLPDEFISEQEKWAQGLQQYLYFLLERIIPQSEERVKYLTEEMMNEVWMKAFTHETFDRTYNYEELEILGDSVLDVTFTRYLLRVFPRITKDIVSNFHDRYMSRDQQGKLANELGMGPHIRTRGITIKPSILEDVFEAFFGALFDVSDRVEGEGFGYINTYNMMASIFEKVTLSAEAAYGRPRTQIKEFFEQLGWGQPRIDRITTENDETQIVVNMTRAGLDYLNARGLYVPRVLGQAIDPDPKVATAKAFEIALETLIQHGVTRSWVAAERHNWEFSHPSLLPYVEKAKERLRQEGFNRMYFFAPKSGVSKQQCVVQLIGVDDQTRRHIPLGNITACNDIEAKRILLETYASGR